MNTIIRYGCWLIIFLACACKTKQKESIDKKTNIIYILVDDMGYGDLGVYGQNEIQTPQLDRMAQEGMRFTQHYAGSSVCAPSRVSLMTGMHTGHSRVRGNYETGPYGFGGELELRPEDRTIAELLKEVGYRTAIIGKWGMGMDGSTGEPAKKGFDYSYGFLNQAHAHWHYPDYLFKNGKKIDLPENMNGHQGSHTHQLFTDEAMNFVKDNVHSPFFLYLAYTLPHAELAVPQDSVYKMYEGRFDEKPYVAAGQDGSKDSLGYYHSQTNPKATYAAMISQIDRSVGRLLQQLKKLGIDRQTVVMFSSDNGPHNEGGADPQYFDSNGPLRGMKRDLYEGGIRVPFIVRWPGVVKEGVSSDHLSAFWDVLPTVADIAGVRLKPETDGISFYPTLTGAPEDQKEHDYLFWEFHERKYSEQAIRWREYKAVRHDPAGELELYNLEEDLGETNDISSTHPQVVARLEQALDTVRTQNEFWPLKSSTRSLTENRK